MSNPEPSTPVPSINPVVTMLLTAIMSYVKAHPEIIDQLVAFGAAELVAWLKSLTPPAPPAA